MDLASGTPPEWRKDAVYYRILTDAEGIVSGREVVVFDRDSGPALCEGAMACKRFDHEWTYGSLGEAVRAAEQWPGLWGGSPVGSWTGYRSSENGDTILTPADQQLGVKVNDAAQRLHEITQEINKQKFDLYKNQGWLDKSKRQDLLRKLSQTSEQKFRAGQGHTYVTVETNDQVAFENQHGDEVDAKITRFDEWGKRVTYTGRIKTEATGQLGEGSRLRVNKVDVVERGM